jgi:hypothetical protein
VHNLAQVAHWQSLVKTSLELQSRPLFFSSSAIFVPFQINRLDQNSLGLLPLVKSINLKEGTLIAEEERKRGHDCSSKDVFTTLDCANLQPAPNCAHLP